MEKFCQSAFYIFYILFSVCISSTTTESNITTGSRQAEYIHYNVGRPHFQPVFRNITSGGKHIYCYQLNRSLLDLWPAFQLQFYAEAEHPENATGKTGFKLAATGYWQGSARLWEIPVRFQNYTKILGRQVSPHSENIVGKTLWLYPDSKQRGSWNLTVEISTVDNDAMIFYQMKIAVLENFLVTPDTTFEGTATSAAPLFFMVNTSVLNWQHLFIEVASNSSICTLLGVQKPNGPFLDEEGTPKMMELSETFTLKAGLSVGRDNFPEGFLLIFSPFLNDIKCQRNTSQTELFQDALFRKKDLRFTVVKGMSYSDYTGPLLLPIIIITIVGLVAFMGLRISIKLQNELLGSREFAPIQRTNGLFRSNINITDLINEEPSRVANQSQRYWQFAFVASAFYNIPVWIHVFYSIKIVVESGDYDLCYFNHFCSHRLGNFHDFNHIYSNIGFVFLGPLYALLVRYRQSDDIINRRGGVFIHYPLLYCMSFVITMIGVLSAGYHVCPNQSNFTFDTVFMYTISAITIVIVHQFRHPTYLSANFTFAALALVACFTLLGLYWEQFLVRVCFTVLHIVFLVSVLSKLCFHGYVRRNDQLVHNWGDTMKIIFIKLKDDLKHGRLFKLQNDVWTAPNDSEIQIVPGPGRLVVPGFFLLINTLAMLAMWTVLSAHNFATQVLVICVLNSSLYIIFYCAVKMYHGECKRLLWLQPGFYFVFSIAVWAVGIFMFCHQVSSWESSPAESRIKNEACILMGFYDYHDMWHFLSSIGLFSTAMLLLTVDDDLVDQPQESIPVF